MVPLGKTPAANTADTVGLGMPPPADQLLAAGVAYAVQGAIKIFPESF